MKDEVLIAILSAVFGGLLAAVFVMDGVAPSKLKQACGQVGMLIVQQDIYQCKLVVEEGRPVN